MSLPHDIDTKSPTEVAAVVAATFARLGGSPSEILRIRQMFEEVVRMFEGQHPGYRAIDMRYHDLEHTLQATVCVCQILEGRYAAPVWPRLERRDGELLLAAVLFHDTGYLKSTGDGAGTGAKYTLVHVPRSCDFAQAHLPALGFTTAEIDDIKAAISCTGPNNRVSTKPFRRPEARVMATILVTSDYLGQMAAADYVEELAILYYEFKEAYDYEGLPEAARAFQSAPDLIRKTPVFWEKFVRPLLDEDLEAVYRFIAQSPDGANPYMAAVEKNIARIRALANAPDISLDPFFPPPAAEPSLAGFRSNPRLVADLPSLCAASLR
jgi:hypothetical protein